MTRLELGEIQVREAIFFILGLAVGFPLSGGKHMHTIKFRVSARLSSFGFLFLICVSLHEDLTEQECRSGVAGSVMAPRAGGCDSFSGPRALHPSSPLPISTPNLPSSHPTAGLPSLLLYHFGHSLSSLPIPGALERVSHLLSLLPRVPLPASQGSARPLSASRPALRAAVGRAPPSPPSSTRAPTAAARAQRSPSLTPPPSLPPSSEGKVCVCACARLPPAPR